MPVVSQSYTINAQRTSHIHHRWPGVVQIYSDIKDIKSLTAGILAPIGGHYWRNNPKTVRMGIPIRPLHFDKYFPKVDAQADTVCSVRQSNVEGDKKAAYKINQK